MKTFTPLLLLIIILAGCKKNNNTTTPLRKDLTQAVYASGKVYPLNDYKAVSKFPGYIEKIHVAIGDSIKVGQALITIKSEVSEINAQTAKNQLDLAKKNAADNSPLLTALKQDVASAKAKYELDSLNYTRYMNLLKENATAKVQFDQAKTQFDISKQNFLKAYNNYVNSRDRVKTEYENARLQYESQLSNNNDYTISSVLNGRVYDIIPKQGELVNSQNILMEIGDKNHFEVELSIDETDVSLIRKGQEIVYSIDAYKDQAFRGRVIEAYPRINQMNKTSKIIASIELPASINVFSGMSVEANIICAERKNVIVIPREYITEGNKVKIRSSGELITIKKGAEDLQFVEVLEGLDENTEIVKP